MSSARLSAIEAAIAAMHQVKQDLQVVSNVPSAQKPDKAERDASKTLFTMMGEVQTTMVETRKNVHSWKRPPKAKKAAGQKSTGQKPTKRAKLTAEDTEEEEEGALIGSPEFRNQVKTALNSGEYDLGQWYDNVTMGNPGAMFSLASTGLHIAATGVAEMESKQMASQMVKLLAPDALETAVLESVQNANVGKVTLGHMARFLMETYDPYHAMNKRPRIEFLQHIVLGVKALQWAMAWSEIEKGSKYQDGRGKVVEDMYKAHRKDKGEPIDDNVEFRETDEYRTFASRVKDYNTGANRFLFAYRHLQSMLFLCPLLNVFRFLNSALGPKIKKAIVELAEDDHEGKLKAREPNHQRILFRTIHILDNDDVPMLVAAIKDINTKLGL